MLRAVSNQRLESGDGVGRVPNRDILHINYKEHVSFSSSCSIHIVFPGTTLSQICKSEVRDVLAYSRY